MFLSYNFYSYISILFRYMFSNIRKSARKTVRIYYFTIIIFILSLFENYLKDVTKSRKMANISKNKNDEIKMFFK